MTSAKEPMAIGDTARSGNWAGATQFRKGGFRAESCRIVAGDDHHFGGGVGSDTEGLAQGWHGGLRDRVECLIVAVDLR